MLRKLIMDDFAPGLTLLFDVPVETGLARAAARRSADGRYESMGQAFHERVREGFHAIAAAEPERVAVIDAAQPVAAVSEAVRAAVRRSYPGEVA